MVYNTAFAHIMCAKIIKRRNNVEKDIRNKVKDRLNSVRNLTSELTIQKDKYEEMSEALEQIKSVHYSDYPSASKTNQDIMLTRLMRKENEYAKLIDISEQLNKEKEQLTHYLKQLKNQRNYRVMWHRYILLLSYKEIAERLDLQTQTIKNIINRSITELVEIEAGKPTSS